MNRAPHAGQECCACHRPQRGCFFFRTSRRQDEAVCFRECRPFRASDLFRKFRHRSSGSTCTWCSGLNDDQCARGRCFLNEIADGGSMLRSRVSRKGCGKQHRAIRKNFGQWVQKVGSGLRRELDWGHIANKFLKIYERVIADKLSIGAVS